MIFRTDLAVEEHEHINGQIPDGVEYHTYRDEPVTVTRISITSDAGAQLLHKPMGQYITLELPPFSDHVDDDNRCAPIVARELTRLLPAEGCVLVVGLGNRAITPDAVGPETAQRVIATRHLKGEWARVAGLEALRPVTAVVPGVMGNTGIEPAEFLQGLIRQINPCCVLAIDALAAQSPHRLGCTIQLCDSGISPGSGVHNARPALSRETLGIPVAALGIPTVIDAGAFLPDDAPLPQSSAGMIVTPREIDLLIRRSSLMAAAAINSALQPSLSFREILQLMA